jgi:peptide/nickel transport system substrate-binding protein
MRNLRLLILLPLFFLNFSGTPQPNVMEESSIYGGVFRMNLVEDFRSLFPPSIFDNSSKQISSQIYEGLVKCNPSTLQIVPCLAQSWEVDTSATRFIFHLRTNVFFQDDACFSNGKGRKLIASDVKYCFDNLCNDNPDNFACPNTFKGIIDNNDAFQSINDSTFSIHTSKPCSKLLAIITQPACWIYPKEANEKYREYMRVHCVGTGPFSVVTIHEGDFVTLKKNPNYWKSDDEGNKLPYLDGIKFTFIKDKRSEMTAFKNKELDVIIHPDLDALGDLLNDTNFQGIKNPFILLDDTALSLTYYGFENDMPPFNNVKVRQAFCYAIDKNKIVDYALQGDAFPALHGFVPPGIPGYSNTEIGYEFDVDKARKLFKQAGYPNGKNFPEITLQINSGGGDRNTLVAEAVSNMLKENLGVTVRIDILPFAQHLDNISLGKSEFWRSGWAADIADPSVFLTLAYGKNIPADATQNSYLNTTRFKNAAFDAAYEKAETEMDFSLRMNDYKQAETIAMQNAFICPLYFETNTQLLYKHVRNYEINGLDIRDLSEVFFVTEKK